MNHIQPTFFGVSNGPAFIAGLQQSINMIRPQEGIYCGDNLFTFGRNLGFLEDPAFMKAFAQHAQTPVERAVAWRMAIVLWGARNGLKLEGDFVECACYKGTTARIVCDAVNFAAEASRRYYLYDLFDHDPSLPYRPMPENSGKPFGEVRRRFADLKNVTVTQGKVPEVLETIAPDRIAFLHLDLNNAAAEIGALEILFDRLVPGAVLILDDYGWLGYRAQKLVEDPWLERRGYRVLELPTGQGLVIKH
jgi:O-methyltransferase